MPVEDALKFIDCAAVESIDCQDIVPEAEGSVQCVGTFHDVIPCTSEFDLHSTVERAANLLVYFRSAEQPIGLLLLQARLQHESTEPYRNGAYNFGS